MKHVTIVAPMEANGRYPGGIMSIANTLYGNRDKFLKYGIELHKFNTYILARKAETIGKFDFTNVKNMFCILKGLLKETRGDGCDVLYYNTSNKAALLKDLLVIRALRLWGRKQKIVAHIHFAEIDKVLPAQKCIRRWMLGCINRYVDRVIFLSANTCREFEQAGMEKGKGAVIYNFHSGNISPEAFVGKLQKLPEKQVTDFLFMGSIESRKGILDLLHVLEAMDSDRARLHICGSCNDETVREEFEALVGKLGSRVIFHGFVKGQEREDIMDQADCLVLPSYGEGFPLVIIDAMAHGSSCISTPVGAVPEFFHDPENGFLFKAGDRYALQTAMEKVMDSREVLQAQMKANYALSRDFSLDCFLDRLQQVL